MNRFFVDETSIPEINKQENLGAQNKSISITGEDVNHIKNVLRLKVEEEIIISDGRGRDYHCRISDVQKEKVVADILDVCDNFSELKTELVLFQGFPKADKMDLIIQKNIELGVSKIVPVMTKRTIVKLDDKKAAKKLERYNSIAMAAAKQCKRGIIPQVLPPVSMKEAVAMAKELDMSIIPYEEAEGVEKSKEIIREVKGKKSLGIFIGPEGGFAREEIDDAMKNGIIPITLGHRILRTETAGMAVSAIVMFELEED